MQPKVRPITSEIKIKDQSNLKRGRPGPTLMLTHTPLIVHNSLFFAEHHQGRDSRYLRSPHHDRGQPHR